jgi:divalent metal cation (Fe/Co/Zn/Cd) transporter
MYKKSGSLVIKADTLHYKTDLLTNLGVIISLIIVKFTGFYYIDFIVGLGIGVYIAKEAIGLIREGI